MTKVINKQQEKFHQLINETFNKMSDAYLERLTDPTREIEEVREFGSQLKSRWKTFCTIKRLNREAFFALDKFIKETDEKFNAASSNTLEAPEVEPQHEEVK